MVFLLLLSIAFFLFLLVEIYKKIFWFSFRLDNDLPDGRYTVESQMFLSDRYKTFAILKNKTGKIFYVVFNGKKDKFYFFEKSSRSKEGDIFESPEVNELFY